jgi:hypothetical protein
VHYRCSHQDLITIIYTENFLRSSSRS